VVLSSFSFSFSFSSFSFSFSFSFSSDSFIFDSLFSVLVSVDETLFSDLVSVDGVLLPSVFSIETFGVIEALTLQTLFLLLTGACSFSFLLSSFLFFFIFIFYLFIFFIFNFFFFPSISEVSFCCSISFSAVFFSWFIDYFWTLSWNDTFFIINIFIISIIEWSLSWNFIWLFNKEEWIAYTKILQKEFRLVPQYWQ